MLAAHPAPYTAKICFFIGAVTADIGTPTLFLDIIIRNKRFQKIQKGDGISPLVQNKGYPATIRMKSYLTKILTVWLFVFALLTGCLASTALAAEPNTPKEEVVYISLDGSGAVQQVDVVNIFDLAEDGPILDYGDYQSIRNMTTTDELTFEDGVVTGQARAGKLYYEGQLRDSTIPWNISLSYTLDGEPVPPEDLAGSSGQLDIGLKIDKNPACRGSFFDEYTLQVSLTLNTDLCTDIQAEDATIANVAGDKQLTYTVLPGSGLDTHIQASVSNFEMDGIAFNGVWMVLPFHPDTSLLTGQVTELLDAIAALDDGAGALAEGAADLSGGTEQLTGGAAALSEGTTALSDAVQSLGTGASQIQEGLSDLDGQSEALNSGASQLQAGLQTLSTQLEGADLSGSDSQSLAAASAQIKSAVDQIASSLSALQEGIPDLSELITQNGTAADGLLSAAAAVPDAQIQALLEQAAALLQQDAAALTALSEAGSSLAALSEGASELQTNCTAFDAAVQALASSGEDPSALMEQLKGAVSTLSTGAETLCQGIADYTQGVSQLSLGAETLSSGTAALAENGQTLTSGAEELQTGLGDLAEGISQNQSGAEKLKEGTSALRENTQSLETDLDDKIQEILDSLQGTGAQTVSFVSPDNVQVESVQFVIHSEAIQIPKPENTPEETAEDPGFWNKLSHLFS